ncbi:MAG TPA: hypothetical protein VFE39_15175 [Pseudonocardia sp.]|nr:hypothetical protein [Pseudonocardia sp.]
MINEAELREMTPSERRKLARSLTTVDYPHPLLGIYLARGRRLGALVSIIACTVLVGWIIVLVLTLHDSFHAQHWTGAWVGFDVILLFAFAATGWAFWRGRQIVIACLIATGTLLCCDAWFDVVLDAGTSDVWLSVASAVVVELPLAFLMFNAARRLIRLSAVVAVSEAGDSSDCDHLPEDELPPLWKIPLFGVGRRPAARASQTRAIETRPSETRPIETRATETRAPRTRSDEYHGASGRPAPITDLASQPWLPTFPRKRRRTRSSSPSRPTPTRGSARSLPHWSSTCTRSPATSN